MELERILLPDAPPRKRSRKQSPERVAIRFPDGTPATAPPPKLEKWQVPSSYEENIERPCCTSSHASCDSLVEVPGFSPIYVKWETGNLIPDKIPSTIPVTSVVSTATATFANHCNGCCNGSMQMEHWQDMLTEKTSAALADWWRQLEEDSDGDEEIEHLEGGSEFTHLTPAVLPDLPLASEQWLVAEDQQSTRVLTDLLPTENLVFDWSNDPCTFRGQREVFTGKAGPTFPVTDAIKPLEVFLKFFDEELLDLLVHETNDYSSYIIDSGLTKHSRLNFWTNTDRGEIATFLAIFILQGLAPLTDEKDYWKESGYLAMPAFKKLMPFNRYVLLKRLLHIAPVRSAENLSSDDKKLQKLQPMLEQLKRKFMGLYLPSRDIAIDESLLKWHGRLTFAQKIATKAAKVGVKSYELCESATGYLWNFFIYTGKDKTDGNSQTGDDDLNNVPEELQQPPPPTNATAQIVHDLAKPLLGKGHTIVMDNFYNSPLLARYLKAHGTDCFGTLRLNREFVPEAIKNVSKSDLRAGEIVQSYCSDLSIMVWRDANLVSLISTFHQGTVGGKERLYRFKPQSVLDYNLVMGGVDKKDQLLSSHPMERSRNKVWYKKVFRRLVNVTVLNSYIIFKTNPANAKITQRMFRFRLAEELVQMSKPPAIETPLRVECVQIAGTKARPILSGNHFVGLGSTKYALCIWCRKSRSKYICKQCNVSLCLLICFEAYHTKPLTK